VRSQGQNSNWEPPECTIFNSNCICLVIDSFSKLLQHAISKRCQVLLKVCGKKSVVILGALCYGMECCNMLYIPQYFDFQLHVIQCC